MAESVGIIVPTRLAAAQLEACLTPALAAACTPRALVIDSSSTDDTVAVARRLGAEVIIIESAEFDHGATRERARQVLDCDIVVMLTQDAQPTAPAAIDRLVAPLLAHEAAASYGRQLARRQAGAMERFDRRFNYPETGHVRDHSDVGRMGVMAFFLSNAFAAYRSDALDEIGGFPRTLSNEDAIVAARLIGRGYRVAYVSEATVVHSHKLSARETFHRYFDTGYARAQFAGVFAVAPSAYGNTGRRYVRALAGELARRQPIALPHACGQLAAKWLGFRLGMRGDRTPRRIRKWASAQSGYWDRR